MRILVVCPCLALLSLVGCNARLSSSGARDGGTDGAANVTDTDVVGPWDGGTTEPWDGGTTEPWDSGTTVPVDTGVGGDPTDAGPPPPLGCQSPLPSSFVCQAPPTRAGATVCTDTMIQAFLDCFGIDGDQAKCTAAQTAYPACNTCILTMWIDQNSIAVASCVKAIAPTDPCATTVNCMNDCLDQVCADCDDSEGSGRTSSTSELDNCYTDSQYKGSSTRAPGACYDIAAKDYVACAADPRFSPCFVTQKSDLMIFYRGACRDGGNWSKATQPSGG